MLCHIARRRDAEDQLQTDPIRFSEPDSSATVKPHDRRCSCGPLWQYQGSVEVDAAVRAWNTHTLYVDPSRLKEREEG